MPFVVKWDVVAAITGIVAVVVTVGIFLAQRPRRILEYSVTTEPLATVSESNRQHITILYDGQPVDAVYYTTIAIRNTGNEAIRPEDFVEPISISVTPGGRLLQVTAGLRGGSSEAVSTVEVQPDGKSYQGFRATYKKTLLNAGEELNFFIIHSAQVRALLNVSARVAGVKVKERSREGLTPDGFISETVRKNY